MRKFVAVSSDRVISAMACAIHRALKQCLSAPVSPLATAGNRHQQSTNVSRDLTVGLLACRC
ncbi:hypothetical protein ACKC9G_13215 [Pokkaliibacter sp. CJK22405]|uniref:hypothetical protein n=1 Tax=Pokkaliibacter sp. CJK22405 TaxID=3384615 RepID=UPI0039853268